MSAPQKNPVLSVHPEKHIISLSGDDVRDFLNDILTAQISTLARATARAACLLARVSRVGRRGAHRAPEARWPARA